MYGNLGLENPHTIKHNLLKIYLSKLNNIYIQKLRVKKQWNQTKS